MCRQGRRFSKAAQATNQCPTSSTSCGYFEFSSADENPKTGVYDCVDGGILFEDSGEVDEDAEDRHRVVRDSREDVEVTEVSADVRRHVRSSPEMYNFGGG